MRLACSTRSFPLDNLALSLARIRWAGFEAAEVALHADAADLPEVDAIEQALRKSEIELAAVDAGDVTFRSADEALEAAAHLGRCALTAHRLDGPRIVFRASGTPEHLACGLQQLEAAMPGYRVDLCPVNAAGGLLSSPEEFAELRQQLGSGRLGLALDPAAASAAGWDPEEFARAAVVPLQYVYLTDTLDGRPALPGDGELDWEALIVALHADGYEGYLSLILPDADPLRAESDAKEARGYAEALIYGAE